jgi:DeoR/GlpR family transcriptional regulator of sugar metabolism
MIAFERRQVILRLLYEQPGITVPTLAKELQVSEGTIRNDFDALEAEQKVQRVRGGAILIGAPPDEKVKSCWVKSLARQVACSASCNR